MAIALFVTVGLLAIALFVVLEVAVVELLMDLIVITGCPGKVDMEGFVGKEGASPYLTV